MTKINVLIVQNLHEVDGGLWNDVLIDKLGKQNFIRNVYSAQEKIEIMEIIKDKMIDAVLLDINYNPNIMENIDFIVELKQQFDVKVIVLTSIENEMFIIYSFLAGASNYVLKYNFQELIAILSNLYKKNSPMEILLNDYISTKRELTLKDLSPSEKEIFYYIQKGYSRSQISGELNKSESTVKNQTKSVCKKLGTCRKKEAIKKLGVLFRNNL